MKYRLTSPNDAAVEIARVFVGAASASIEVLEDKSFKAGSFWDLGEITVDADNGSIEQIARGIRRGAFQWTVRDSKEAADKLVELLEIVEPAQAAKKELRDQYERSLTRVDRIMDAVATAAVRVGLVHPVFDSQSVENMPFRQGTTVIADTSGVLQGGLDFVSRFLHPAARIKIPAVVHMEVVNQADNFLKRRRATKTNASALLFDHLLSQAGQRALLRLELRADTEVERSLLVGDPLRNAFQRDTDAEWNDLQLSVPLRSYCDRLIIETARQHQSHSNPGHQLQLLTSDQGFARMALAEGVAPLFFKSISSGTFFGRVLSGIGFHPFRPVLHQVPLQDVLWEFATAFGAVRIASVDRSRWVEIAAFGEGLTWSPVHSQNDLLWIRHSGLPDVVKSDTLTDGGTPSAAAEPAPRAKARAKALQVPKRSLAPSTGPAFYRFNLERMLNLILKLAEEGRLPEARAQLIADAKDERGFSEFRRFLLAGELATRQGDDWELTEAGLALAVAIRGIDHNRIAAGLAEVPSVGLFFEQLRNAPIGQPVALELSSRAETTYRTIAEVCIVGAQIANEGFYSTPTEMPLRDFAAIALDRFRELESGDGLVSVGAWLEALIRKDGLHPERSRRYLDEAQASGLINRSTEGSTTDTRHDQHAVRVLRGGSTGVRIDVVHLYRGDFLIPNKSSSSLRLGAV